MGEDRGGGERNDPESSLCNYPKSDKNCHTEPQRSQRKAILGLAVVAIIAIRDEFNRDEGDKGDRKISRMFLRHCERSAAIPVFTKAAKVLTQGTQCSLSLAASQGDTG